jgi:drug/metabolite transporter (DMT)-like permease
VPRGYVPLLLLLAAIWGASFMFIEIALDDLEPTTLMAARVALAALGLVAIMLARRGVRRTLVDLRAAGAIGFALGVINSALPFTLIAWGQEHIDSGTAAIGNASMPIWVAVLAVWWRDSERATGARLLGVVLGLVGVGILTGAQPQLTALAALGTLAVIAASISYAAGSLIAQDRMAETTPLALSTASMLGATLVLTPFGLAQLPSETPGWDSVGAVVFLALAATTIGILLFFRIIDRYGSFRAGLVTYLLPVTALIYGTLLLDEGLTIAKIVGLVLILSGVALGSGLVRPQRQAAPAPTTAP